MSKVMRVLLDGAIWFKYISSIRYNWQKEFLTGLPYKLNIGEEAPFGELTMTIMGLIGFELISRWMLFESKTNIEVGSVF